MLIIDSFFLRSYNGCVLSRSSSAFWDALSWLCNESTTSTLNEVESSVSTLSMVTETISGACRTSVKTTNRSGGIDVSKPEAHSQRCARSRPVITRTLNYHRIIIARGQVFYDTRDVVENAQVLNE